MSRSLLSLFVVLLGLAVILPLINYHRPAPVGDFHGEWFAAVTFALASLAAIALLPQRQRLDSSLLLAPAVLASLLLLQLTLGKYEYVQDWALWLVYLGLLLLALIVGQGLRAAGLQDEVANRLCWSVIIVGLVSFLAQVVQLARAEDVFAPFIIRLWDRSTCRPYGNVGQANHASTVAWLAVLATLYLRGVGRLSRFATAPLLGALLLSAALAGSRTAWLLLAVGVFVVLAFRCWPAVNGRARLTAAIALVGGFALATFMAAGLLSTFAPGCVSSVDRLADTSGGGYSIRFDLWKQALLVWQASPWIGSGANSFMGWAYHLAPLGEQQPLDAFVHNSALQLLAEFGLLGAGVVVAVVLYWLLSLYLKRRELHPVDALLSAWLGILGVHSMVEFPLWYTHFLFLFGIVVGLLMAPGRATATVVVYPRAMIVALAICGLAVATAVFRDYKSLDRAVFLYSLQRAVAPKGHGGELEVPIANAASEVVIYRLYLEYFLARRVPLTKVDIDAKIAANTRLLQRGPLPDVVGRQILLLALKGDMDAARWHMQRMMVFYPFRVEDTVKEMRALAATRPTDFNGLGNIIDQELAEAPRVRW